MEHPCTYTVSKPGHTVQLFGHLFGISAAINITIRNVCACRHVCIGWRLHTCTSKGTALGSPDRPGAYLSTDCLHENDLSLTVSPDESFMWSASDLLVHIHGTTESMMRTLSSVYLSLSAAHVMEVRTFGRSAGKHAIYALIGSERAVIGYQFGWPQQSP